jgi:hypothetical protein
MNKLSKYAILALPMLLVVASMIMIQTSFGQSVSKPSVPEFTLKLVGPTYVQNTTYSLDPNTGQIVAKIGYTNPYSRLEIRVKNQVFDQSYGHFFYNVRVKYHNLTDQYWTVIYNIANYLPMQSTSSDYTDVGFSSVGQLPNYITLPGTQIDIQVKAMLGGEGRVSSSFNGFGFVGEESDWSSTQTINIPANTPLSSASISPSTSTITPLLTPTPPTVPTSSPYMIPSQTSTNSSVPQLNWLELGAFAALGLVVALLVVFIVLLRKRIRVLELKQNGA